MLLSDSPRPSWHEYFMNIAEMVATRATCPKISVGAVVVKDRRIIGTGYNGAPRGIPHCTDHGCCEVNNHCTSVVHAEVNAVLQALMGGSSTEGAIIYCTTLPCVECSKVLMNAGIKQVVYQNWYIDNRSEALGHSSSVGYLQSAGIGVESINTLLAREQKARSIVMAAHTHTMDLPSEDRAKIKTLIKATLIPVSSFRRG